MADQPDQPERPLVFVFELMRHRRTGPEAGYNPWRSPSPLARNYGITQKTAKNSGFYAAERELSMPEMNNRGLLSSFRSIQ
jgi:hypothetical protein